MGVWGIYAPKSQDPSPVANDTTKSVDSTIFRSPSNADEISGLTAVVEEHVLVDGQDAAAIHYVTKKFVFANHEWNLVESHVSRLG